MITCPHMQEIASEYWGGMAFYRHICDGVSCSLMNSLCENPETILTEIARANNYAHTVAVHSALIASSVARLSFFRYIASSANKEELSTSLELLISHTRGTAGTALLQDAAHTFGDILIVNLEYMTGDDYSNLEAHTSGSNQLPMLKLLIEQDFDTTKAYVRAAKARTMRGLLSLPQKK